MKLPQFGFIEKLKIVLKNTSGAGVPFLRPAPARLGAARHLYSIIDRTQFPEPTPIADVSTLFDNGKGKALGDNLTHQMRYELNCTFGWSINDILFNRFVLDNRAYRQYGVYHATKVLMDLYSMTITKLVGPTTGKTSCFLQGTAEQISPSIPAASFSPPPSRPTRRG
ncbi:MAG: hypothetical protein V8Q84_00230 [Bilophila sp.]